MKKLFTLLLMLAALLSSTQAWAQGLKICGISVNVNATAGNQIITGAGISGKVEYNPQSRVLMLTNATLTSSGVNDGIYCYGMTDFQIFFSGTVNITTNSDGDNVAAIYCSNNIKLNGWSSEAAPVVNLNNHNDGQCFLNIQRLWQSDRLYKCLLHQLQMQVPLQPEGQVPQPSCHNFFRSYSPDSKKKK